LKKILFHILLILIINTFTVFSQNSIKSDIIEYFEYINCNKDYIIFPIDIPQNTINELLQLKKTISNELLCQNLKKSLKNKSFNGIDERICYSQDENMLIFISVLKKLNINHKVFYNIKNNNLYVKCENEYFSFNNSNQLKTEYISENNRIYMNLFDIISYSLICNNENLLSIKKLDNIQSAKIATKISPYNNVIKFLALNKTISQNKLQINSNEIDELIKEFPHNFKSDIYTKLMEYSIIKQDYFESLKYCNYFNKLVKEQKIIPEEKEILFTEYIIPIICYKKLNNLSGIKKTTQKINTILKNKYFNADITRKAIYFLASSDFYEEAVDLSLLWSKINSEDIGLINIKNFISNLCNNDKYIEKIDKAIKSKKKYSML